VRRRKWTIRIIGFLVVIFSVYISWHLLSRKEERVSIEEKEWEEEEEIAAEEERLIQLLYASVGVQRIDPPFEAEGFTLEDLRGSMMSLKDFRGKVIFLNFWASWCGPCRIEMPAMELLWQVFQDDDFVILAVDVKEERDTVSSFIEKNDYTFPVLLDSRGKVASMYDLRAYPTSFLIDREGRVVGKAVGAREWASKDSFDLIKYLLDKKETD
jgi:thiol-disulfide isomerase/thioredoxin